MYAHLICSTYVSKYTLATKKYTEYTYDVYIYAHFGDGKKFVGACAEYLLLISSNMYCIRSSNMQYICIKTYTCNEDVLCIRNIRMTCIYTSTSVTQESSWEHPLDTDVRFHLLLNMHAHLICVTYTHNIYDM